MACCNINASVGQVDLCLYVLHYRGHVFILRNLVWISGSFFCCLKASVSATLRCNTLPPPPPHHLVSGHPGSHHPALRGPREPAGQGERCGPHHRRPHPQVRAVLRGPEELPGPGPLVQGSHLLQVGARVPHAHALTWPCPSFR